MIVKCLDIVKQRLKFWFILVKAILFWTIWRKSNNFMCYCWCVPSLLPLSKRDWNFDSFWQKLWYFEKFVVETTILYVVVDGSPFSSPCYLWYNNKISTSVKSLTIQKKTKESVQNRKKKQKFSLVHKMANRWRYVSKIVSFTFLSLIMALSWKATGVGSDTKSADL